MQALTLLGGVAINTRSVVFQLGRGQDVNLAILRHASVAKPALPKTGSIACVQAVLGLANVWLPTLPDLCLARASILNPLLTQSHLFTRSTRIPEQDCSWRPSALWNLPSVAISPLADARKQLALASAAAAMAMTTSELKLT